MCRSPRFPKTKVVIAVFGVGIHMWCSAEAQDFMTRVADSGHLGLRGILPSGEETGLSMGEGFKGGFAYGVGIHSVYDSNFFLDEHDPQSELTTNISPRISYVSDPEGGARVSFTASYEPIIRNYQNNSDLDGIDQAGGARIRIEGSKTAISAYARYSTVSGTDRLTGEFVNNTVQEFGIQGTYQIAPRTSLFASSSVATSSYGASSLVGSDIYNTEVGSFWSATERLSFGPSIRYTVAVSDNTGTRDAWELNMQARYKVGERIDITGALGIKYANGSGDDEKSTVGLTGYLTASYAISEMWGWTSSIRYVTVPSANEQNYVVDNLTISTALSRQLLRATMSLGLELNISNYQAVGPVESELATENNLSVILSYRRNLFLDRVAFQSEISYTVNNGQTDWSQVQVSAGFKVQF